MSVTNFKTENNTLRKLFGNGLYYRIPRFQRDYSWEEEQWEDLWLDIESLQDQQETSHYMGYLVLQSTDDKTFSVIDGQQRLTTCSIIILAVLKCLSDLVTANIEYDNNSKRMDQIRQTYIGYLDPVTLVSKSKLILNRNNDHYFQTYIVPLDNLPLRGFRSSEHLLRKAFEWFYNKISLYFKNYSSSERGMKLAEFVENITDKLFFTVITVSDELNAYKVFETLNARGVRLSSTDLLKNYLFSVLDKNQSISINDSLNVSSSDLNQIEKRWNSLVERLQSEKFPDFLRTHWNSYHKIARQTELFKVIRKNITDRKDVFDLIRRMDADLDNYLALTSPDGSGWNEEDKKNSRILKMFSVRQPFSLLLAAKRVLIDKDFSTLLKAITIISFRFSTIGGYSPTELEKIYNEIAVKLSSNEINCLNEIWPILSNAYIPDSRFYTDFSEKVMPTSNTRTKKIVRYILCSIEKYVYKHDCDYHSEEFNIEHILPQNAPDGWENFNNEESESLLYRLGNMTLFDTNRNRDIGVKKYENKKDEYSKSIFGITKRISESYSSWSPENIASNQKWMASQAKTIWQVSQLENYK